MTLVAGMWPDPADNEADIDWVRDYHAALGRHTSEGGYINFMAGDGQGPRPGGRGRPGSTIPRA